MHETISDPKCEVTSGPLLPSPLIPPPPSDPMGAGTNCALLWKEFRQWCLDLGKHPPQEGVWLCQQLGKLRADIDRLAAKKPLEPKTPPEPKPRVLTALEVYDIVSRHWTSHGMGITCRWEQLSQEQRDMWNAVARDLFKSIAK